MKRINCKLSRKPKIWIVSRHPGAIAFMTELGFCGTIVSHITLDQVMPGDTVVGVLPLSLSLPLQESGALVLHLVIDLPAKHRGQELSSAQLKQFGARICHYQITELANSWS
jgi:putative CRISPR-associated protein (TIGR02620 family)